MAARRSKNSENEKLTPANLDHVIALLEDPVKPITKKDACAILNIAYNTTRLTQLLDKHREKKTRDAERRAALRGKPATKDEIIYIISSYLQGTPVEAISSSTYRGNTFIKNILDEYGVPIRARSHDYFKPELIPEKSMRTKFELGDLVYSARYDSLAKINHEIKQKDEWVYRIYLLSDKYQMSAYQPASELASLSHLAELGVTF